MSETLKHGMNCAGLIPGQDEDCTCGLKYRIMLQTEQEMHAAWRKRAEEAEAELQRYQAKADKDAHFHQFYDKKG